MARSVKGGNNTLALRDEGRVHCRGSPGTGRACVRVGKGRIFDFTIDGMPRTIGRLLSQRRISYRSVDCCLLRRTGRQVVHSTTEQLNRSVSGFPVGVSECNGASSTDLLVLLSRVGGDKGLRQNSEVILTNFNNKLACKTDLVRCWDPYW